MQSPEQLFERFRRRADAAALAAVFDQLAPELLLIAGHVAAADAEDLVQATFLDAIEKRDRWDVARPLLPWLIGILVNHARADRRGRLRRSDAVGLAHQAESSPFEALAATEVREQVAAALRSLPRQLRVALTMRLAHGLTPTEIAHALGCPLATVKTRLQRGREWLRKVLPTGITLGAVAALTADQALAATRDAVMAKANALVPVAEGSGLLGGLLMKKAVVVVVALIGIAGSLWAWQKSTAPQTVRDGSVTVRGAVGIADMESPPSAPATTETVHNERVSPPTVVAANGSAELQFVWRGEETPAARLALTVRAPGGDPLASKSYGTTDSAGLLHLSDLAAGSYSISGPQVRYDFAVRAGEVTRERIEVEPFVRFSGRVVDNEGRGIAGATIGLEREEFGLLPQPTVAVTDDTGAFRGCLDNGGWLWASKEGFARSAARSMIGGDNVGLQFVLSLPLTRLRGVVYSVDGRPAAAQLAIVPLSAEALWAPLVLHTDASGRFATDELHPGAHLFVARAADHAATPAEFSLGSDGECELALTMTAGATVFGDVVLSTGASSKGTSSTTTVTSLPSWAKARRGIVRFAEDRAFADKMGHYRLEHVPAGGVALAVPAISDSEQELVLLEGEQRRHDFAATGQIRGRIVDAEGMPLTDWWVIASSEQSGKGQSATVGPGGLFQVNNLAGGSYRVAAMPTTMSSGEPWIEVAGVRPGSDELVLRVIHAPADGAWLVGTVLLPDGQVPAKVSVSWRRFGAEGPWQNKTVAVDANGHYEIGPLPPGGYELGLSLRDVGKLRLGRRDLLPRARIDLGTSRMPGAGALALAFVGVGAKVTPSDLWARDDSGNFTNDFRGGEDGFFRADRLPAGTYRVTAWGENFAPVEQEVVVVAGQTTEQQVRVTAAMVVCFALTRAGTASDERWTAGVVLKVRTKAGELIASRWLWIDTTGAFAWPRGLAPGDYRFEAVIRDTNELEVGAFTVTEGAAVRVEIELPAAR